MDGIAEKFSAFDFFNHILGGTVFFAALYPLVSDRLKTIEKMLNTLNQYSSPILIFVIFIFFLQLFLACSVRADTHYFLFRPLRENYPLFRRLYGGGCTLLSQIPE